MLKLKKKYEKMLKIRTLGIREWRNQYGDYNRYEATPYFALDELFKTYRLQKGDEVVDFGCGRGRVAFYLHYHFHVAVTGIENNELTFQEALDNQKRYELVSKHIQAPLYFEYGLAEQFAIEKTHNRFYFFHPFSARIFRKVVANILRSVEKQWRSVDIILFYPTDEYIEVLRKTPFRLMTEVSVPQLYKNARFQIYRLYEDEQDDF